MSLLLTLVAVGRAGARPLRVSHGRGRLRDRGFSVLARGSALAVAAVCLLFCGRGVSLGQDAVGGDRGALFPRPLLVEHSVVHRDGRGGEMRSPTVTDVYAGSFLVSQRPDGSKRIVDLVGRQLTATNPAAGTYWTVSFDRLADLRERAVELERLPGASEAEADGRRVGSPVREATAEAAEPELVIEELPVRAASATATGSEVERAAAEITSRPGVRRLRVRDASVPEAEADVSFEAWVDPNITLSPRALAALATFEREALGGKPGGAAARLDAARRFAAGGLSVRTRRSLGRRSLSTGGAPAGTLEDAVSRVEWLDAAPEGLLEVAAGLVRVPHPLEMIVAAGERERALLSGGRP